MNKVFIFCFSEVIMKTKLSESGVRIVLYYGKLVGSRLHAWIMRTIITPYYARSKTIQTMKNKMQFEKTETGAHSRVFLSRAKLPLAALWWPPAGSLLISDKQRKQPFVFLLITKCLTRAITEFTFPINPCRLVFFFPNASTAPPQRFTWHGV